MLVVSDSSEVLMLQYILNKSNPSNLTIHLYSNNVTPGESSTITTFTEVTGFGYNPIALIPANWTIVIDDFAKGEHTEVTWTFTGAAGAIYGYYVTRQTGELMWAERFTNGPYTINTSGDEIRVTPRLSLG
jgi:hypothetical protein